MGRVCPLTFGYVFDCKMVNDSRYYTALESVSIASALSSALTIYPSMPDPSPSTLTVLNFNFLQLGRRSGSGARTRRTLYPRRLPVNTVIHTTLAGIEPITFRLLVRRATSSATDSPISVLRRAFCCFCNQSNDSFKFA